MLHAQMTVKVGCLTFIQAPYNLAGLRELNVMWHDRAETRGRYTARGLKVEYFLPSGVEAF